jgi:hypothetical protein
VAAFPPRPAAAVGTVFRRPCGSTRPSDSSRLFAISSFRSRWLPPTQAEAERSPRVRTQNFMPTPSPIRPPDRRIWASLPLASSPSGLDASSALRFRSVRHSTSDFHSTLPRGLLLLAAQPSALVSLVWGFLRQEPQRTFTSCSAPMPGAPRPCGRLRRCPSGSLDPPRDPAHGASVGPARKSGRTWPGVARIAHQRACARIAPALLTSSRDNKLSTPEFSAVLCMQERYRRPLR